MVGQMPLWLGVCDISQGGVIMIHFVLTTALLYIIIPLEYLLNALGINIW